MLDEDGYLTIVDRKKELIINAAGKNMSPANIEATLKTASPLIGQACCIGDGRPFNTALIVLDADFAPAWAAKEGIEDTTLESLAGDERVRAAVQAGVDAANEKLARVEQIKQFTIVEGDWLPGGDELTPTMKLKRKPIAEKYEAAIEAMYAELTPALRVARTAPGSAALDSPRVKFRIAVHAGYGAPPDAIERLAGRLGPRHEHARFAPTARRSSRPRARRHRWRWPATNAKGSAAWPC